MTKEKRLIEVNNVLELNDENKIAEVITKLQEECSAANPPVEMVDASGIVTTDSKGNTILNLGDAETHVLQTFPIYDGRGEGSQLNYCVLAITPKFDVVLKSEIGMNFLKQSYDAAVIKKIRDNVRNAAANKRVYTAPRTVEDFLTASRATTGSEAFKKIVAELCPALRKRFAKFPSANAVITQKTIIEAMKNEALAQQVFSFMIEPESGKTIFDKLLTNIKSKLVAANEPTAVVDRMIKTRNQMTIADENDESEELFNVDDLI